MTRFQRPKSTLDVALEQVGVVQEDEDDEDTDSGGQYFNIYIMPIAENRNGVAVPDSPQGAIGCAD